jgi:hypothetical protein
MHLSGNIVVSVESYVEKVQRKRVVNMLETEVWEKISDSHFLNE